MGISSALVARLYGEIVVADRASGREAKQHAHDAAIASEKTALEAKKTQISTTAFVDAVSAVTASAGAAIEANKIEALGVGKDVPSELGHQADEIKKHVSTFQQLSSGRCDPRKPAAEDAQKAQATHARIAESAGDSAASEAGSQQAREQVSAMLRNLQSKA